MSSENSYVLMSADPLNQLDCTLLFKHYSLQADLDKIDVIELFETPEHQPQIGEALEKQKAIYQALGVTPPTSL